MGWASGSVPISSPVPTLGLRAGGRPIVSDICGGVASEAVEVRSGARSGDWPGPAERRCLRAFLRPGPRHNFAGEGEKDKSDPVPSTEGPARLRGPSKERAECGVSSPCRTSSGPGTELGSGAWKLSVLRLGYGPRAEVRVV